MGNLKGLIVCILILIILTITLLVLIINNSDDNGNYLEQQQDNNVKEDIVNPKEVTNPHMYMTVKSCIEKYINYIYVDDNISVYRIIDNEYINKFNLTEKNILENIEDITNPATLEIEKMYVVEENEYEQEYYVSATIKEESVEGVVIQEKEFIVTVKLDINNMIYSIIPNGYGGPLYEEK